MSQSDTVYEAKARLREEARARRTALAAAARAEASAAIADRAIPLIERLGPEVLAAYFAVRSEVDTRAILAWAERAGLPVALPAIEGNGGLAFRRFRADEALAAGGFGIPTPLAEAEAMLPDVLIVPMLAFDRTGTRLGYGRGHYDRAIAHLRNHRVHVRLVGVAFAVQEVAAVPAEVHDVRMDFIVTEAETIDLTVGKAKG